jgi:hypothetical protein
MRKTRKQPQLWLKSKLAIQRTRSIKSITNIKHVITVDSMNEM